MVRLLTALLLTAAFCLGVALGFYNWADVTFHYLAGQVESPLILLLVVAFALGAAVMWLLTLARSFVLGRESRRLQRQIRELEAELKNLRSLPLASTPPAPPAPPSGNA